MVKTLAQQILLVVQSIHQMPDHLPKGSMKKAKLENKKIGVEKKVIKKGGLIINGQKIGKVHGRRVLECYCALHVNMHCLILISLILLGVKYKEYELISGY